METTVEFSERFARNVEPCPTTGCWLWTAALVDGYGVIRVNGRQRRAHRVAWEMAGNTLPEYPARVLDHWCDTRSCVNPDHLRDITNRANILRGGGRAASNAVKIECPMGHLYTPKNTRMHKGRRHCRTCARAYYHLHPVLRVESAERARRTRASRTSDGLTTRGTPRKNRGYFPLTSS